ncbi:uncharacterized protein TRIADDRAFT_51683 [Trichoplax adhaerens]|uniref:Amine oxidase n=1 Tax=Trichoplax adhaerens TaxID=10228 RepID=B3RKH5_TRIAD|nr:hypothetical protein TRIADDRAFT_51683 [Trichoplax adhaerens]EDV29404.1 hypothetical protein TRIADDRAFT_51683 [Trichoplax adhaerens]|eukprot:XP_002108606.1 hypothetical protein TRIADDRAFT_51683 [Trichoplax adhaerens]
MATTSWNRPLKVVIIGAGVSGLAIAELLSQYPCFKVLLLEASQRIGGRVNTKHIDKDSTFLELGASYIHGSPENPIYEIAHANKIPITRSILDFSALRYGIESNQNIDETIRNNASHSYYSTIEMCKSFATAPAAQLPEGINSVGTFLRNSLRRRILDVHAKDRSAFASIFHCFELIECAISGCNSLHDLHLKDFGEYHELDGHNWEFTSGYDNVIQHLINNLKKINVTVQTNTIVELVDYNDSSSYNRNDPNDSKSQTNHVYPINVICKDGKSYTADHVVCTVSLGVLKEMAETLFNPTLPQPKLQAINRLGFGTVNKVFLFYREPFWSGHQFRLVFVWNDQEYKSPSDRCLLSNDDAWLRNVSAVSTCQSCKNALVFWIAGSPAIEIEKFSNEQISLSLTKLLKMYMDNPLIQPPYNIIKSCWHSNPHTRGSYSYVSTAASGEDFKIIEDPILDKENKSPLIMFAGEATHRQHYSTVHGAYLSGRREAMRLLGVYGLT